MKYLKGINWTNEAINFLLLLGIFIFSFFILHPTFMSFMGATYEDIYDSLIVDNTGSVNKQIKIYDGDQINIICSLDTEDKSLGCVTQYVDIVQMYYKLTESKEDGKVTYKLSWEYLSTVNSASKLLSKVSTTINTDSDYFQKQIAIYKQTFDLTGLSFRTGGEELIGYIEKGLISTDLSFNTDVESLRSLVLGHMKYVDEALEKETSEEHLKLAASEVVDFYKNNTGIFKIRDVSNIEDGIIYKLLLTGSIQALIIVLGFFVLICSFVACMFMLSSKKSQALIYGTVSTRLNGLLTYIGLLGTLYGVFLAVNNLSSIDFTDNLAKAFDQTRTFGNMSLAIGSSVVGLSAAIINEFFQSIFVLLFKVDPFKDS